MKKFFAFFAALLFAGSMMADSYTISFKDAGEGKGDSSTSLTSTTVADYVAEGADYVSAIAASGKVYNGQEGYGLKFGNSSNPGAVTLTLATAVKPTSIVMNASPWSTTEGAGKLQDSVFATTSTGAKGTFADFTYVYDGATEVTTIIVGTSTKRGYVKSITVNFGGEVVPPTPTPTDTYTVAGNDAAIFGTSWDVTNTANDMVKAAGIYKWEKAELNLTAGTIIAFKVAKNHSWDVAYPAQNDTVTIAEEGEYTLTITFDPATEAVAAEAVKKVPLADPTNCAEAAAAALTVSKNNELYNGGKEYTINGYVTEIAYAWSKGTMSFWMADAADGGKVLEAYKCAIENEADAVLVGDKVAVTGKLTKYNTTPEFAEGCTVTIIERAAAPENLGEKTIAEFLALKNMKDTCVLTGVITNVVNTEYGNFYLADATDTLYVYGLKDAAGAYCFEAEGLAAGDTLTVKAVYNEYNKAPQAKNAVFVSVKKAPVEPGKDVALVLNNGMVSNEYIEDYGSTDIILFNIPVTEEGYIEGDGDYLDISIFPEDPNDISGTYTVANEGLDIEYTYLMQIAGTDTTEVDFVDGNVVVAIADADPETWSAKLTVAANLTAEDGTNYIVTFDMVVLYDFIEEEQGVENVAEDAKKVIKKIEAGNIVIEKNGVKYSVNGQVVR